MSNIGKWRLHISHQNREASGQPCAADMRRKVAALEQALRDLAPSLGILETSTGALLLVESCQAIEPASADEEWQLALFGEEGSRE